MMVAARLMGQWHCTHSEAPGRSPTWLVHVSAVGHRKRDGQQVQAWCFIANNNDPWGSSPAGQGQLSSLSVREAGAWPTPLPAGPTLLLLSRGKISGLSAVVILCSAMPESEGSEVDGDAIPKQGSRVSRSWVCLCGATPNAAHSLSFACYLPQHLCVHCYRLKLLQICHCVNSAC